MKIGFILVLFKTPRAETYRLHAEIKKLKLPKYQIYNVDNTRKNKGFAGGVNIGIGRALRDKCDLIIVMNPDISLYFDSKITLSHNSLKEAGQHFDIWGYVMQQNNTLYCGGRIDSLRMSGGLIQNKPKERFSSCDFVSGSFICIKASVIKEIGLFDERYFMYYEDVEYCARAMKIGYRVGIDTSVVYEHFETSQNNHDKQMYLARNRVLFMMQYGSIKQKIYEFLRLPRTLYEERKVLTQILAKDRFFINFISLNISSFINKILFFLLFIFLFRYLGVNQYGVYTLVWAHTAILSPIVDLGTTSYGIIYSPNEPLKKLATLISLRTSLSVIIFILTILLAVVFRYDTTILMYVIFTSFVIFSNALSGSYLIVASLLNKTYISSLVSFIFNLILVVTQVFILIRSQSITQIFVSIFVFYVLYSFLNAYLIKKFIPEVSFFRIDISEWRRIISRSYIFVLIGLFAGLYYKIDVFLLNFLKGATEVGVYSAGYKFLEAFLFIPASYNITSTPIFARLQKQSIRLLKNRIKRDAVLLSLIGFGVSLTVFFVAPFILPKVMNQPIAQSIPVLKIVIFTLPFTLISSVFFNTLYVLNRAKFVAGLFLVQTIAVVILNYIFIPIYSYTASAYITVIAEIVNLIVLIIAVLLYLKKI